MIFSFLQTQAQNIQSARNQGIGATVTISGIVTNGSELGIIRYIEDSSAGLAIYDQAQTFMSNVMRGDSITVSGELVDYNGLLELNPINSLTVHSQNNNLPTPQIINANQMGESTEGELVRINNVVFDNAGGTFSGNSTESFTSNGQNGIIYIKTGCPLENTLIPSSYVDLVGISSQFSFTGSGGYQLLPRDTNDIITQNSIYLISPVSQENITTTSFDLYWNTNIFGSTNYKIGLSPSSLVDYNIGGNNINHNININNLNPATIYYIQCYSINGVDTAFSPVGIYSTASLSSGEIKVYFNNSVDHSVADGVYAQNITTGFNDTIAALINKAESTLDICVYNHANSVIENAINDAYNRGVKIRYITCESTTNLALGNINSNIPVLKRPNGQGIMHNKFIIVDADSSDNSYILSGSTNWTSNNLFDDYNNLIIIQDESLAKAYELEFNEMWGSDSLYPNANNAKFGPNKTNNTPHDFVINGKKVELYFSPSDNVTSKIINNILTSNDEIDFALLAFTKDEIADAIISMIPFATAKGIIEQANNTGSEYQNLLNSGVNVIAHSGNPPSTNNVMHHKYCIIDGTSSQFSNSAKVITGSHNWSAAAENNNDENTLIINDFSIANQYFQEFSDRFNKVSTEINEESNQIVVYPNPFQDIISISSNSDFKLKILQNGKKIKEYKNTQKINLSNLSSGVYTLVFETNSKSEVKKIIKY